MRVGNAASDQFQLDVYGELVQTVYQARRLGVPEEPGAHTGSQADGVRQPGLAAARRRHLGGARAAASTSSTQRLWPGLPWTASCGWEKNTLPAAGSTLPAAAVPGAARAHPSRYLRARFQPRLNSFTQAYNSETLDASLLLIPALGFLPADDPRVEGTIRAIEKNLLRDGFVLRYQTEHTQDGLTGSEGAFLACSFWLVDAYTLCGRKREAEELFGRLVGLRNDLGLLSEEYEPRSGRLVGNFPQAFSHLALIHSASVLAAAA